MKKKEEHQPAVVTFVHMPNTTQPIEKVFAHLVLQELTQKWDLLVAFLALRVRIILTKGKSHALNAVQESITINMVKYQQLLA